MIGVRTLQIPVAKPVKQIRGPGKEKGRCRRGNVLFQVQS